MFCCCLLKFSKSDTGARSMTSKDSCCPLSDWTSSTRALAVASLPRISLWTSTLWISNSITFGFPPITVFNFSLVVSGWSGWLWGRQVSSSSCGWYGSSSQSLVKEELVLVALSKPNSCTTLSFEVASPLSVKGNRPVMYSAFSSPLSDNTICIPIEHERSDPISSTWTIVSSFRQKTASSISSKIWLTIAFSISELFTIFSCVVCTSGSVSSSSDW